MGNFLSDLGKGFVRSAVNQVGRDGGRVISNSVYGDAHAMPIRGIYQSKNNQYFDDTTNEIVSPEELRKRAEEEGFNVSICKYKTSTKVVWYIISLFSHLFTAIYYSLCIWDKESLSEIRIYAQKNNHSPICIR